MGKDANASALKLRVLGKGLASNSSRSTSSSETGGKNSSEKKELVNLYMEAEPAENQPEGLQCP